MKTNTIFIHLLKTMTYSSNYETQGKFYFFDSEEHLRREWKQRAKMNIKQQTFLEGILLKSLDHESKFFYGRLFGKGRGYGNFWTTGYTTVDDS